MDYQIINLKEFKIMGISTRTSNEKSDNQDVDDIGELWKQFRERNIRDLIPHKEESQEIVSLYTDYQTDFNGPYTVVLGYRVTLVDAIPEGMIVKNVSAAKYAVIHVQGENLVEEIVKAWQWVWTSNLQRTYTGDFDVYKPGKEHEADIFVAIK